MAGNYRNEASSSGGGGRGESVLVDCGRQRSSCGYCRSPNLSSRSHGLWMQSLTVDDYQDLLDRGWRRSGSFLYKPDMSSTCCPSYTIRLKAADFSPSKEQNRVHRRMERFPTWEISQNERALLSSLLEKFLRLFYTLKLHLTSAMVAKAVRLLMHFNQIIPLRFLDGTLDTKAKYELLEDLSTPKVNVNVNVMEVAPSVDKEEDKNEPEQFMHYLSDAIDKAVHTCIESERFPANLQLPKASVKGVSPTKKKQKLVKGLENLLYTSNIAFQLAATLRHARSEKKDEKQSEFSGNSAEDQLPSELPPQTIGEKLAQSLSQMGETSGLLIHAYNGHLNFYSVAEHTSAEKSGQEKSLSEESLTRSGNKRRCMVRRCNCCTGKRRKLEILLKRSTFEPEEFELYRRYQLKVHNDDLNHVTESSYKRFLVDTPLVFVPSTDDGSVPPCGFGSFHQSYVIDGRLVAVAVVDILPKCLSSKYLFWDPDFAFLSLGKYSALQEINCVKENQFHCPSLQYYYLGYYVHSCSKMTYKTAYRPSELLCPLRFQWVPFDVAKPLLDRSKYVVLSDYKDRDEKPFLPPASDHISEHQHEESEHEDSNDLLVGDEEMLYLEEEDSDVESGSESSDVELSETEYSEIGNTLIEIRLVICLYVHLIHQMTHWSISSMKDLLEVMQRYVEGQVQRYVRVVGRELSERMVYSLERKDLQGTFNPVKERYLEAQVQKYVRVVGRELSERMVYSLDSKDSNDLLVGDEEMFYLEEGGSDVESESESSDWNSLKQRIDLRGAFDPGKQRYLEARVQRYVRVVGRELSERMVYSLG
ncbi:hypothetical protein BT93_K0538 [Corymbia citriodora subsp. variegata]|nr:hypothetical protein BT93_K0538 [Corymbia citriodora subsp. variegata]